MKAPHLLLLLSFVLSNSAFSFTEEKFQPGSIPGTFYEAQNDNALIDTEGFKIQRIDSKTGVRKEDFNTLTDSNMLSLTLHSNSDILSFGTILGVSGSYGLKSDIGWWEFLLSRQNANFEEVTSNNAAATESADSDELEVSRLTISTAGFGVSYRSNHIQNYLKSDAYFEIVKAYATYNFLGSDFFTETFRGFGIQVEYGIHKRISEGIQWGVNTSYHGAIVKRQAFGEEASSARTLNLSWLNLGLVATFFY